MRIELTKSKHTEDELRAVIQWLLYYDYYHYDHGSWLLLLIPFLIALQHRRERKQRSTRIDSIFYYLCDLQSNYAHSCVAGV